MLDVKDGCLVMHRSRYSVSKSLIASKSGHSGSHICRQHSTHDAVVIVITEKYNM